LALLGDEVTVFTPDALNCRELTHKNGRSDSLALNEIINGVTVKRFPVRYHLHNFIFDRVEKRRGGYRLTGLIFGGYRNLLRRGPLVPAMTKRILSLKPAVTTIFNICNANSIYAYRAKRIGKNPLAIVPCLHVRENWVNDPLIERILKSADLVVALTRFEKDFMVQKGVAAEKIAVIGPGINPAAYEGARPEDFRKKHQLGENLIVSYAGRIAKGKNIQSLVGAMRLVWAKNPDAKLLLAGTVEKEDDFSTSDLIDAIEPQWRRNIILLKDFSDNEKKDIFAAIDIFVLPSVCESFGIVLLEAWVSGKPVVVCRDSAPASVVEEGKDGLLFNFKDEKDLASVIARLLNDSNLRHRLGENGRRKVLEQYTWDLIAQRFREEYRRLVLIANS